VRRCTNERGDRTRVIVYLRAAMNLTSVTYHSKLPSQPWRPVVCDCSRAERAARPEDHDPDWDDGQEMGSLPAESESQRGWGEYEWEGPPGDPFFPSLGPSNPTGRYKTGSVISCVFAGDHACLHGGWVRWVGRQAMGGLGVRV